jgi:catechol 2,3-dioxygenase-like lactoylglutathione lyase family enzyme
MSALHTETELRCDLCAEQMGLALVAPERMFGFGGSYEYACCPGCGLHLLANPPTDFAPFYPATYYAFTSAAPGGTTFERSLRRVRARLGRLPAEFAWMNGRVGVGSVIVDYGSGNGRYVAKLRRQGFHRAIGVDPYANEDAFVRRELPDGPIALFTLHHSLEHITDQRGIFTALRARQRPGSHLFIRTPLADSYAARHYGPDWVQLDPPRHVVLHTTLSLTRLAGEFGYEPVSNWRDSNAFQFWGSEMYRLGIPLTDPRSPANGGDLFTASELDEFSAQAELQNAAGMGDQGAFLFRAT